MIEHIVLFRWKLSATPEQIQQAMTALKNLKPKINGILDLSCGENFSDRSKGFTHGLVVRLKDRQTLNAYFPHPEHQVVVELYIKPILDDILSVDYEL